MLNLPDKVKKKFAKKKVLLVGLGLQGGGEGTADFLINAGAKLTITDLMPEENFKGITRKFSKKAKLVLGRHRKRDFKEADLIVKNPATRWDSPFIKYAKKIGKTVLTETGIFFDIIPREKIIGITGTKGKTTTAMLLTHLLKDSFDVVLVGNIPDHSPLGKVVLLKKMPDFFVYELSSFNLEGFRTSPKYALITNIFPDHLNRYGSFSKYARTKANIFKNQKSGDVLWLNKNDKVFGKSSAGLRSKIIFLDSKDKMAIDKSSKKLCFISQSSIRASVSVASFLGIKTGKIKKLLNSFRPALGRMEYLGKTKGGIHLINDTASTNPSSTLFGLHLAEKCLGIGPSRIILIAGGENKRLDYSGFSKAIRKLKKTILLPGTASRAISYKKAARVSSLNEAIEKALDGASGGDCVLFSPAAASFNMFKNEFDRGYAFKKTVKGL